MTTYNALRTLITNNRYTYEDMYAKLDMFLALDRISMGQYIELTGLLVQPIERLVLETEPVEE